MLAAMGVPIAAVLTAGGGVGHAAKEAAVVQEAPALLGAAAVVAAAPGHIVDTAQWRAVEAPPAELPPGRAPEAGLQVKTILAARAISAAFPEILAIGGVRPDSLRWHPNGLALDVMISNYNTAEGIALGDQIVAFAMANADRFALQDCIWRGTYYTPGGAQAGNYGHYDHVHITTKGGGYPTGAEVYTAR